MSLFLQQIRWSLWIRNLTVGVLTAGLYTTSCAPVFTVVSKEEFDAQIPEGERMPHKKLKALFTAELTTFQKSMTLLVHATNINAAVDAFDSRREDISESMGEDIAESYPKKIEAYNKTIGVVKKNKQNVLELAHEVSEAEKSCLIADRSHEQLLVAWDRYERACAAYHLAVIQYNSLLATREEEEFKEIKPEIKQRTVSRHRASRGFDRGS